MRQLLALALILCCSVCYGQTHTSITAEDAQNISGTKNFKTLNATRFADQFAAGSNTGGLVEAYADCIAAAGAGAGGTTNTSGCKIQAGSDITISAAQTLTLDANMSLFIDFNGKLIKCANGSGRCLSIVNPACCTFPNVQFAFSNATLQYTGAGTSVTGIYVSQLIHGAFYNFTFENFSTSGSIALNTSNFQNWGCYHCTFHNNNIAWQGDTHSDNWHFIDSDMRLGSQAIVINSADDGFYIGGKIEQNTATCAVTINDNSVSGTGHHFITHMEANGDGTANASDICVATTSPFQENGLSIEHAKLNAGTAGQSGTVVKASGTGTVSDVTFLDVNPNGFLGALTSGLTESTKVTCIDVLQHANQTIPCTVALNANLSTGNAIIPGESFNPVTGTGAYSVHAGTTSDNNGKWMWRDETNNAEIMNYNPSGTLFTFNKPVSLASTLAVTGIETIAKVQLNGSAPTCSATGAGSTATCTIGAGSTDTAGQIVISSSGTGQAATGTVTVTFNASFTSTHGVECMTNLANTGNTWDPRATVRQTTAGGVFNAIASSWDNNSVLLVAGNNYRAQYFCFGR